MFLQTLSPVHASSARLRHGAAPHLRTGVVHRQGVGFFVRDEVLGRPVGSPLLLLHGLGLDHHSWDLVADRLLRSGHRVIRADLRGHGRSDGPTTGYRLDDLVADVVTVLDALDVGGAHVVGHSLGGTVGLQLALQAPDRVRSSTLLGALVAGQTAPPAFLAWAARLFELLPRGLPALLDELPGTAAYQHQLRDPELVTEVRRSITTSLHAAAFIPENFHDLQLVSGTSPSPWQRACAGALRTPLLTLDGSADPVVAGIEHPASEEIPGARGVVLDGAGHLALLEQPVTVARHLSRFTQEHEAAAGA